MLIETFLTDREGEYAGVVRKIENGTGDVTDAERIALRRFAYLQMSRTEQAVKRRTEGIGQMDEAAHRGMEAHRKGTPNLSHGNMIRQVIMTFLATESAVQDLEFVLLRNRTHRDFVTSDDPAVLTNRVLAQRQGVDSTGLISTGVQLTMPFSPKVALVCFDTSAYVVSGRQGQWVDVCRYEDVLALNELQYLSCNSNLYFRNRSSNRQWRMNKKMTISVEGE